MWIKGFSKHKANYRMFLFSVGYRKEIYADYVLEFYMDISKTSIHFQFIMETLFVFLNVQL